MTEISSMMVNLAKNLEKISKEITLYFNIYTVELGCNIMVVTYKIMMLYQETHIKGHFNIVQCVF